MSVNEGAAQVRRLDLQGHIRGGVGKDNGMQMKATQFPLSFKKNVLASEFNLKKDEFRLRY